MRVTLRFPAAVAKQKARLLAKDFFTRESVEDMTADDVTLYFPERGLQRKVQKYIKDKRSVSGGDTITQNFGGTPLSVTGKVSGTMNNTANEPKS